MIPLVIIFTVMLFLYLMLSMFLDYCLQKVEKEREIHCNEKYETDLEEYKAWAKEKFDVFQSRLTELDQLKSRMDTLNLKAGFKL